MNEQTDPVCGMTIEESNAAGQSEYQGKPVYFCSSACQEKFAANPTRFKRQQFLPMIKPNRILLIIALLAGIVLFLIFGGGSMPGSGMNDGMMGQRGSGGFGWMWISTLLTLGVGVFLGWLIFAQKK